VKVETSTHCAPSPAIFVEHFGEPHVQADRKAAPYPADLDYDRFRARRVPARQLVVGTETFVIAGPYCSIRADQIEAIVRPATIFQRMDTADHDPEVQFAREPRDLARCLAQAEPILAAPLLERGQHFPSIAGKRTFRELHQIGAACLGLPHQ
jgi:hypothetical protein